MVGMGAAFGIVMTAGVCKSVGFVSAAFCAFMNVESVKGFGTGLILTGQPDSVNGKQVPLQIG